jgi:hypothetical protein
MRYISLNRYQALIAGGELLREDLFGPKVYQTADGRIVKLFRVKHWWSSSMLYPYSIRFRRNSRRLKRRGFRCVTVDETFYCRAIRRHGVIYRRLDGKPLDRLLVKAGEQADRLYLAYAAFIALLHARRIYFRSLHPGNVLLLPDNEFGLIDIGDMRYPLRALTVGQRRRNLRHLLRSAEFRGVLQHHRGEDFVDAYLEAAQLPGDTAGELRAGLLDDFERAAATSGAQR